MKVLLSIMLIGSLAMSVMADGTPRKKKRRKPVRSVATKPAEKVIAKVKVPSLLEVPYPYSEVYVTPRPLSPLLDIPIPVTTPLVTETETRVFPIEQKDRKRGLFVVFSVVAVSTTMAILLNDSDDVPINITSTTPEPTPITTPVPEPGTLGMFAFALLGLLAVRGRRR